MSGDLNFFFETFSLNTENVKKQSVLEAKDFVKFLNFEKGSLYLIDTDLPFLVGRRTGESKFGIEIYETDNRDGIVDVKPNNMIMYIDLCILRIIGSKKNKKDRKSFKWVWSALFVAGEKIGHFPLPVNLFPIDKGKKITDDDINPEAAKKALKKLFSKKMTGPEIASDHLIY